MANIEVRELIRKYRLKHYEVAQALGIHECTLSRWLRTEFTSERKQKVINAIESIK